MSSESDTTPFTTTTVRFTDTDGNPLSVDNNPAHFEGLLHEIREYCERHGKFKPLVENGAVSTSSGKTIVGP